MLQFHDEFLTSLFLLPLDGAHEIVGGTYDMPLRVPLGCPQFAEGIDGSVDIHCNSSMDQSRLASGICGHGGTRRCTLGIVLKEDLTLLGKRV